MAGAKKAGLKGSNTKDTQARREARARRRTERMARYKKDDTPRGEIPIFTPTEVTAKQKAIEAEGSAETKLAIANGQDGLYFFRGKFFEVKLREIKDVAGEVKKSFKVIADNSGVFIHHNWLFLQDVNFSEMKRNVSGETKKRQDGIRADLLEYAGEEIRQVKAGYVAAKKALEEQAETEEILAEASNDLALLFINKQDGLYKTPDGVVVDVIGGKIYVEVGNAEISISKVGNNDFYLPLHILDTAEVKKPPIANEKHRDRLHAWQTALHKKLKVLMNEVTTLKEKPTEEAKTVSVSDDLMMVRQKVAGHYRLKNGVVISYENNNKGGLFRVQNGNGLISSDEENGKFFLPAGFVEIKTINPNEKLPEEKRIALHAWQVSLQMMLKNALDSLPPVEEPKKVVIMATPEVKVTEPVIHRLKVPSFKQAKPLNSDTLKNMSNSEEGLFFTLEKGGRAYFFAEGGYLWLIGKTPKFPEDHIVSLVLDFHKSEDYRKSELVDVSINNVRGRQGEGEIPNLMPMKEARKAVQRYLHGIYSASVETNGKDMTKPSEILLPEVFRNNGLSIQLAQIRQ